MTESTFLNNQFLIAMPNLADPGFFHTVTYLCQHNTEGALGIMINRPAGMKLGDIYKQMGIPVTAIETLDVDIFSGGPVQQERGFVIHDAGGEWDSSILISEGIALTTSRDVLEAIANGTGPKHYLVALGYAGWGAGQLEQEFVSNAWLTAPCATDILFTTPFTQRWNLAAKQLGVDINLLTMHAGHA
ncbi:MAG: YqgE/AlgH family protein [Methylococcales bacterium]